VLDAVYSVEHDGSLPLRDHLLKSISSRSDKVKTFSDEL
jgi:hypothetical protein